MNTLEVVVGGQYGSEAKGHITQRLTERAQSSGNKVPQVIRVAGPNAGHTGYDANGGRWALRQVPVAAVTEGPAMLGIAAGSEIDPNVLLQEIDDLTDHGLMANKVMWISEEATIVQPEYQAEEQGMGDSSPSLVERIGSTGKGIGAARAARIKRTAMRLRDSDWLYGQLEDRGINVRTPEPLDISYVQHTIIEGTQGYGLGLHQGNYPQCTSSDCRAIDFMSMAGINPWQVGIELKIYVVARVFPIRVAGNSGPLMGETSWAELGLPEEYTTVTKKVRRVGMSDWSLVNEAVRANGGAPAVRLALTMLDQQFPKLKDQYLFDMETAGEDVLAYLRMVQHEAGAPIEWVATGPNTATNIRFAEI